MTKELSPGAEKAFSDRAALYEDGIAKGRETRESADKALNEYKRVLEIADKAIESSDGAVFARGIGGIVREAEKNGDIKASRDSNYVTDNHDAALIDSGTLEGAAIGIAHANYDLAMEQNPAAKDTLSKAKNSEKYWDAEKGGYGQAAYLTSVLKLSNARGMTQPLKSTAKETSMSKETVNAMAAGRETK